MVSRKSNRHRVFGRHASASVRPSMDCVGGWRTSEQGVFNGFSWVVSSSYVLLQVSVESSILFHSFAEFKIPNMTKVCRLRHSECGRKCGRKFGAQ